MTRLPANRRAGAVATGANAPHPAEARYKWLSAAVRISLKSGNPDDFPGDTFGIATSSPTAPTVS